MPGHGGNRTNKCITNKILLLLLVCLFVCSESYSLCLVYVLRMLQGTALYSTMSDYFTLSNARRFYSSREAALGKRK